MGRCPKDVLLLYNWKWAFYLAKVLLVIITHTLQQGCYFLLDRFISCLGLKFLGTSGQNGTLTLKKSQLARRKCPWIPSSKVLQSLKHAFNLGLIKQQFNNCWLKAYSWLAVWSWNGRSSFCLHFHRLPYLLPNSQCLFFCLHFHPLLHLLPNGQCLFFSKRILLITVIARREHAKGHSFHFCPSDEYTCLPCSIQGICELRYLLVAFSFRLEIRPRCCTCCWTEAGLGSVCFLCTGPAASGMISYPVKGWYLTFMQSSAIHRTFSCQHK